jgi:hypothetical protein
MDLRKIGWKRVDCVRLAQDRNKRWAFVRTVMNLGVS